MANKMIIKHFAEMLCKCRQRKTKRDDEHGASDWERVVLSSLVGTPGHWYSKSHHCLDDSGVGPLREVGYPCHRVWGSPISLKAHFLPLAEELGWLHVGQLGEVVQSVRKWSLADPIPPLCDLLAT